MTTDNSKDQTNKILFANLIIMLSSSAMQQLGKLVDPLTNKTETNLEAAQMTIDMLDMLKEKTRGNLDKDENKMLGDILSSLQMNYVATAGSATQKKESAGPEPAQPEQGQQAPCPEKTGQEKKEPIYRKSYGA